jgi:hypothetical protein
MRKHKSGKVTTPSGLNEKSRGISSEEIAKEEKPGEIFCGTR